MSALFPDDHRLPAPYVRPQQAQRRPPTPYENRLGDALEAAFAAGAWELDALVARLNAQGVPTPDGGEWTVENFEPIVRQLG